MKLLTFLLVQLCFLSNLHAGARGCMLGIVDVSTGTPTKESKRLFELLVMDADQLYVKDQKHPFAWTPADSKVDTINPAQLKGVFSPMISLKKKATLMKVIEKNKLSDGLIVFEYDHKAKKARFKLFDMDGTELALIKLPLEKNGAMKYSLFKHVRRSSLTALGLYVRFSP